MAKSALDEAIKSAPKDEPEGEVDVASVLERADVQAAVNAVVARAVAAATADIMAKLEEVRASQASAPAATAPAAETVSADTKFAETLARSIVLGMAQMTDQGVGKKPRLDPAVIEERDQARAQLENLLIQYRASETPLQYELRSAVYLDEILVQPTYKGNDGRMHKTRISWDQAPNEAMRPVNPEARMVYMAFMRSIGGATVEKLWAEKSGKRSLNVPHMDEQRETAAVGRPRGDRGGSLNVLTNRGDDELVETNVLGTLARPARQLA